MSLRKILLATASTLAAVSGAFATDGRPNILLVLSDDHSAPDLGCYGNTSLHTPNLDRFAAEGMRFDAMYTAAPQCVPSRASLLTGVSPVAARISRFSSPLPRDVVTLPELLRDQGGYFTGICRRYFHLDGARPKRMTPFVEEVYEKHDLRTFAKRVDFLNMEMNREKTPEILNQFFDKVPGDKPWFLWVNFVDPHDPWDENEWSKRIDRANIKVPGYLPDMPGVRDDLARFYGEVDRMDEEFGWVMDVLKKRGFSENTLVIFMGDNGYSVIRGKGTLYDEGLHVPLLVRWPGKVKSGAVAATMHSGEDLTPTCLAAAGLQPPSHMTGRSFLPMLKGEAGEPRRYIFAERGVHGYDPFTWETKSNTYDLGRCVRSDRYKLIYNCTPWMPFAPCEDGLASDPGWSEMVAAHGAGTLAKPFERLYFTTPRPIYEFYDLEKDPWELHNVAGQPEYAEAEKELRHALIEKMLIDFDYLPLPAE